MSCWDKDISVCLLNVREYEKVNSNLNSIFIIYIFYKEFPGKLRKLHARVLDSPYKTLSKDIPSCLLLSLRTIT